MTDSEREALAREVLAQHYEQEVPESEVAKALRAGEKGVISTTFVLRAMLAFSDREAVTGTPEAPEQPASPGGEGWVLVPREPTREWAYAIANARQGQRSTPHCEPPSEYDLKRAVADIRDVLAAAPTAKDPTQ